MTLREQIQLERGRLLTRRWFFQQCGVGLAGLALAHRAAGVDAAASPGPAAPTNPLRPRPPHFAARAKRVIYLFQAGAPSQIDLFDHKPTLTKYNGQPVPQDVVKDQIYAFIKPDAALFASTFQFRRHGQSGAEISEAFPQLASVADELCIIRSMNTHAFNHAPAQILMNTGSSLFGRPSLGAWATYGLGSESQELPGFVVLSSAGGTSGGASNWGCGFLPTVFQGVPFRRTGDPILSLSNPPGVTPAQQRQTLDLLKELNSGHLATTGDPEIATRIASFEMAFRMQTSGPELMDLSRESRETLALYGAEPGKPGYAMNCLLARRLVERGVRFVQLFHEAWDHHSEVHRGVQDQAAATDRANAALIQDLKQRGLLDDTLVIWGGEFGRTPMVQQDPNGGYNQGRDHHPQAFTMWLAGGGVKRGLTLGETDELGFHVVRDRVHVHDLHATILHLLGFDHTRLTFRFQGRDFRLTDVHGEVVKAMLA
jgi:hypothetical protein